MDLIKPITVHTRLYHEIVKSSVYFEGGGGGLDMQGFPLMRFLKIWLNSKWGKTMSSY